MASMNVSLPNPMRDWVQSRIDSGQYASVSDYVRDLIRRDQNQTQDQQQWLQELDASLERSFGDLEAGRVHDAAEVFDGLAAKYRKMAQARAQS